MMGLKHPHHALGIGYRGRIRHPKMAFRRNRLPPVLRNCRLIPQHVEPDPPTRCHRCGIVLSGAKILARHTRSGWACAQWSICRWRQFREQARRQLDFNFTETQKRMPKLEPKYKIGQPVEAFIRERWREGKVYKVFPKRLYQVIVKGFGYTMVTENNIRKPK